MSPLRIYVEGAHQKRELTCPDEPGDAQRWKTEDRRGAKKKGIKSLYTNQLILTPHPLSPNTEGHESRYFPPGKLLEGPHEISGSTVWKEQAQSVWKSVTKTEELFILALRKSPPHRNSQWHKKFN